MERLYHAVLKEHFQEYTQMALVSGPRQAGKTTIAIQTGNDSQYSKYLN